MLTFKLMSYLRNIRSVSFDKIIIQFSGSVQDQVPFIICDK